MHYLYGRKKDIQWQLVATFDSEQQLLAYVGWATLKSFGDQRGKFEQGTPLAGYVEWKRSAVPLSDDDDPADVVHNPTPSML